MCGVEGFSQIVSSSFRIRRNSLCSFTLDSGCWVLGAGVALLPFPAAGAPFEHPAAHPLLG